MPFSYSQRNGTPVSLPWPKRLQTEGLGTCIGVAVIHGRRGFDLHAANLAADMDSLGSKFISLFSDCIPLRCRASIEPVVVGGAFERFYSPAQDKEIHRSIAEDRLEIQQMLHSVGFASVRTHWGEPDKTHSLYFDLWRKRVCLEIENRLTETAEEKYYPF